ncbi:hypothetical protein PTKIN_Ptkin10aG0188400 [Pterospermum kingtungense]
MVRVTKKIFSKSLTDTDIKKRLSIPAKILSSLPDFDGNHAFKIDLMYGTSKWPIVCSIRKNGYKKPVFSGGWRDFIVRNNFNVGDRLTLYKVLDEAGSFLCYRVQVEKPTRPSWDISPPDLSHSHEVDQSTDTNRTKACNFENEQDQLLKADVEVKQEKAVTELVDVAADAPVASVGHVIAKTSIRIFGINVTSHETTSKADHFNSEEESKLIKLFGFTMSICELGEQPLHSFNITNEKKEIKSFGLNDDVAMAHDTSQAVGDAYYRSLTEGLGLDLILGQPTTYAGVVNLDLTLAPPDM